MIMKMKFTYLLCIIFVLGILIQSCTPDNSKSRTFDFSENTNRIWIGPDFWANRLQDWSFIDGKLICNTSSENRNVQFLTYFMKPGTEDFRISTKLGFLGPIEDKNGWIGFRLATRGRFNDYRDDAIYGEGISIGISTSKELLFGTYTERIDSDFGLSELSLEVSGEYDSGTCERESR